MKEYYSQTTYKRELQQVNLNIEAVCDDCKKCCLQNGGCHFSPDDFKEKSFEYLRGEIEKGYISISNVGEQTYCGMPILPEWTLKVRRVGAAIVETEVDYSKTSGCILFAVYEYCPLAKRPTGCLNYIPGINIWGEFSCRKSIGMYKQEQDWRAYQDVLLQLVEVFKDCKSDYPCMLY